MGRPRLSEEEKARRAAERKAAKEAAMKEAGIDGTPKKRGRKPKATEEIEDKEIKSSDDPESIEETPKKKKSLPKMDKERVTTKSLNIKELPESVSLDTRYEMEAGEIESSISATTGFAKAVSSAIVKVDKSQIRFLVKKFYQAQEIRKTSYLQLLSLNDTEREHESEIKIDYNNAALVWLYEQEMNNENQIKKLLADWVEQQPMGRYLTSITGIGPIFAANLISSLDIHKAPSPTSFHQFCGLNDNRTPWLGRTKAEACVNEVWKKLGLTSSDEATDQAIVDLANMTGRKPSTIIQNGKKKPSKKKNATEKDNEGVGKITKASLISYLSMPPYDIELKSLCYLIGKSFMFNMNRGSRYGLLYADRLAYETRKNENGDYAETAKAKLDAGQYKKGSNAHKALLEGKLGRDHLIQRSMRWATKIFINHLWEAMYYEEYQKLPRAPYVLVAPQFAELHQEYLRPEVNYIAFFNNEWGYSPVDPSMTPFEAGGDKLPSNYVPNRHYTVDDIVR